jgi:hypothetical protein
MKLLARLLAAAGVGLCLLGPLGPPARATNSATINVPIGVTPALTFAPASLNFPNTALATSSSPQTVVVANIGLVGIPIGSVTLTGAAAGDFSKTTTCSGTLAPAASCNVVLTFSPTVIGNRTATLEVSATGGHSYDTALAGIAGGGGGGGGTHVTFALDNSLTPAAAVAAPLTGALSFGTARQGLTGLPKLIVAINTGTASVSFGASPAVFSGANAADWALATGPYHSCAGATLATIAANPTNPAAYSCAVYLAFKPATAGAESSTLTLTDSNGNTYPVLQSGTGTAAGTVVNVPCGASLGSYISGSSPAGTIYQLAGSAASHCTYNQHARVTTASNITIQGDCSSYVGANTILDGGSVTSVLMAGNPTFYDNTSGVKVSCLDIEHYGAVSPSQCQGTSSQNDIPEIWLSTGWVGSNLTIANSCGIGFQQDSTATLQNSVIHDNAVFGGTPQTHWHGTAAGTMTLAGDEFYHNSTQTTGAACNTLGDCDAFKAVEQTCCGADGPFQNLLFTGIYSHDNDAGSLGGAVGMWCDENCAHGATASFVNSTVKNNGGDGIRIEISGGGNNIVSHNVVVRNDVSGNTGQASIMNACSPTFTAEYNYVDQRGLQRPPLVSGWDGRCSGTAFNITLDHNVVVWPDSVFPGWWQWGTSGLSSTGSGLSGSTNSNAFYTNGQATGGSYFRWQTSTAASVSLASFQGAGHDTGSTLSVSAPSAMQGCTIGPGCVSSGM